MRIMNFAEKRVFVGLSGGVDSAVSAALLAQAGAIVTGVFINGWYPEGMPCTWREDRRDAMRIAARLHIPFLTLDASEAYKKSVIDYLIREYAAGRTPNPDVMCNRDVKFGVFHRFAKERGASHIATGHYASIRLDETPRAHLLRGTDHAKDQSYFLWAVPEKTLRDVIFPVGNLRKEAVRGLARRFHLPVANKKDSQGICFLGPVSVEDFLRHEIGTVPGIAQNEEGAAVGRHDGAVLYTIGERVPLQGATGPWYVVRKDIPANTLVVARKPRRMTGLSRIRFSDANWIGTSVPGETVEAEYRYHGPRVLGTLGEDGMSFIPNGTLPETPAEGQSLVLYRGTECIGGGIIGA